MTAPPARERFLSLLQSAIEDGTLVKLTLGKPAPGAADATLRNVFVRPVTLRGGPHLTFVFRHATRDITKNHPPAAALEVIRDLLGREFLDAHAFTPAQTAQLELAPDGTGKLRVRLASAAPAAASTQHDREKSRLVAPNSPWLSDLGVTTPSGLPREGMAAKLRQIEKFTEILQHLLVEADLVPAPGTASAASPAAPLRVADMGSGKGYLTFAAAALLGDHATVTGIESRPELVELCNRVATTRGFRRLTFLPGEINHLAPEALGDIDVLLALHACDTATDDALARGVASRARLLIVSPCCQKEVSPQLRAPAVLADALKHGIFHERQAEFVTDALRAQLLEWAGYRTKVFEFVSTEHTAKNTMIAAIRTQSTGQSAALERLRAFAAFYGVRSQRLASHLGVSLEP
ncbi:MAG: SAM-dependent methyltransferase [Opitutaceae bacterium]|nr:SAM-dependent methyltransferase [Opitutaceae bacterium]